MNRMMQLDPYQEKAAITEHSRVLVSAAPGSGKTRLICARFAYMVDELHIPASQIVLLTFTRYAAEEMRQRIGRKASGAFIGTFHAFALKLLKEHGHVRGWEPDWLTILDEKETELDEREILRDMGVISRRGNTWRRLNSREWKRFVMEITSGKESESDCNELMGRCWEAFYERLRSENCTTFGTMILEALILLEHRNVQQWCNQRYAHILIDEAQDSDANQWRMIEMIDPKTLFVVGDIDQAIYHWRGAAPNLFLKYSASAEVHRLPHSYRFDINIGKPASELISHNNERLEGAIDAISQNKSSLEVITGATFESVSDIIQRELADNAPEDIVVLARKHAILDGLAGNLRPHKLPFERIGGDESIVKSAPFRTVRSYLRLGVNPSDRRAFMGIAAAEGLDTKHLWTLRSEQLMRQCPLVECYNKELPKSLDEVAEYLNQKPEASFYAPTIQYLRNYWQLNAIANEAELVQSLALQSDQDQLSQIREKVTLQTIHASKGLEWPVVILMGLNADQFPSRQAVAGGEMEGERRLMYVGMTRAERKLYLVHNAEEMEGAPSVFLNEFTVKGEK